MCHFQQTFIIFSTFNFRFCDFSRAGNKICFRSDHQEIVSRERYQNPGMSFVEHISNISRLLEAKFIACRYIGLRSMIPFNGQKCSE